jgi:hypothetical protein
MFIVILYPHHLLALACFLKEFDSVCSAFGFSRAADRSADRCNFNAALSATNFSSRICVQGTFKEPSGNLQETTREKVIQETFRRNIGKGKFKEHSGNIQGTFREHRCCSVCHELLIAHLRLGNIQGTFREPSGDNQGERHSGNIQEEHR